MSIYTRSQLLQLRDCRLTAEPNLPEWITPTGMEKAAKERPPNTRTFSARTRNGEEILLGPQTGKFSSSSRRDTQDRTEHERPELGRAAPRDSEHTERAKDPKRPEEGEENFSSRRGKKGPMLSSGNAYQSTLANGSRTSAASDIRSNDRHEKADRRKRGGEGGWLTTEEVLEAEQTGEVAARTLDDFEKWRASMKSGALETDADATDDIGVDILSSANAAKTKLQQDEPRIVKPPPGLGHTTLKPENIEVANANMMVSLFGASSPLATKMTTITSGSPSRSLHPRSPQLTLGTTSGGGSKFSKFFSATQTPAAEAGPSESVRPHSSLPPSHGSREQSLPGDKKKSEDAEGFERILAMLTQSAPNALSRAEDNIQFSNFPLRGENHINFVHNPRSNGFADEVTGSDRMLRGSNFHQDSAPVPGHYPEAYFVRPQETMDPFHQPQSLYHQQHSSPPNLMPQQQRHPNHIQNLSHHMEFSSPPPGDFFNSLLSKSDPRIPMPHIMPSPSPNTQLQTPPIMQHHSQASSQQYLYGPGQTPRSNHSPPLRRASFKEGPNFNHEQFIRARQEEELAQRRDPREVEFLTQLMRENLQTHGQDYGPEGHVSEGNTPGLSSRHNPGGSFMPPGQGPPPWVHRGSQHQGQVPLQGQAPSPARGQDFIHPMMPPPWVHGGFSEMDPRIPFNGNHLVCPDVH